MRSWQDICRIGKRFVRKLVYQHYYTAKAYNHLCFVMTDSRSRERILVYQMGKVGSSTIVASLQAARLNLPVHHVHFLTVEGIAYAEKIYKDNWHKRPNPLHLWHSQYLRRQIAKEDKNAPPGQVKWKVVTLVRDPIAHLISAFFQVLDSQVDYNYRQKARSLTMQEMAEELISLFRQFDFHRKQPLTWFDAELKSVFGVDVLAEPFPKQTGYKIYARGSAEILLFKVEKLNECASPAFQEFLHVDGLSLVKTNEAFHKAYASLYQQFLAQLTLPVSYVDHMYASPYVTHFYSEEEIQRFRAKWCKRSDMEPTAVQGGVEETACHRRA
jgi:hypothetical protein